MANILRRNGEFWEVNYEGATGILEDCRGLRYIALLIESAGLAKGPIHAKELVALATGQVAAPIELEAASGVLDARARAELLARLQELASERDRACAAEEFDRAANLDDEYERVAGELGAAAGRGRGRRGGRFSDAGEKARKAVSKAITEAVERVASCPNLAPLAEHLTLAVRKGRWLSYEGHSGWQIDGGLPPPAR